MWAIAQQVCCQTFQIAFYRVSSLCSDSVAYWRGAFTLSDLKFDIDTGSAELVTEPKADDGYQTLMELWEKPVNWMQIEPAKPIYSSDRSRIYTRSRLLTQLLAGMTSLTLATSSIASMVPTVGVDTVSAFLENAVNPVTRRANTLLDARVIQASDVFIFAKPTDPYPTGYAVKAPLSLRDLVGELQSLLRLFPFIDPATGKLRWEHESYFPTHSYDAPKTGNLSNVLKNTSAVWAGKRTLTISTEELYGIYKLTIGPNETMAPDTDALDESTKAAELAKPDSEKTFFQLFPSNPIGLDNFKRATIEFNDACVRRTSDQKKVEQPVSTTRFATNITRALELPDNVDRATWIFLVGSTPSTDPTNPIPQIPDGLLDEYGFLVENGDFSAANLLRDFHRHNQPFGEGAIDVNAVNQKGTTVGMLSTLPTRQLEPVNVDYCCTDSEISLLSLFESWYGNNGHLLQAEYTPSTNALKLQLAHAGPCQLAPPTTVYDPVKPNKPGCDRRGTFLRIEKETVYNGGSAPIGINLTSVFADGQCGEYKVTSFEKDLR